MREVVLVNKSGEPLGTKEILAAHTMPGFLHAAFSAFVLNKATGEILLQKRSDTKPLFARHWGNTCCSHPFPEEDITAAGERRLQEELGFTTALKALGSFVYRAEDTASGLVEHEYDTVLFGTVESVPEIEPNPEEVSAIRWVTLSALETELQTPNEPLAPWLPQAFAILQQHLS